jgi:RNA polymerase sigma-70 factor (ECF subfamily)
VTASRGAVSETGAGTPAAAVADAVARAHPAEWARVVSTLIRITGDWSLAEDCTAAAFETALTAWRRDGIPTNPGAWLTTVAKNRALDALRRAATLDRKLEEVAAMAELTTSDADHAEIADDRLALIFTCCHPALAPEARVALTLRTVGGLTTPQIARGFFVPEATIAQRIVRAKRKIAEAGIPYRVPEGPLLGERLDGVLTVLSLVFTTGYTAAADTALATEAIRLARALLSLMPDEPEVAGLLALMLFQHSRRDARLDAEGVPVTLEHQDRSRWHASDIDEGRALLAGAARRERPGRYQVQAAIAAVHATAAEAASTDWPTIVALYDALLTWMPTRVVALNRAIAVGMARTPVEGIAALDAIVGALGHLRPAARADLLLRAGRTAEAEAELRDAIALAPSEAERRALEARLP